MQKSKITTITIIIILFVYALISRMQLTQLGSIYTLIINPLFFLLTAIILKKVIPSVYNTNRYKKEIIQYVLITILCFVILYSLSGLLVGFGNNPYSVTLRGIVLNLYVTGLAICCKEYIRYKLLHNVYKNDKKLIFVLLVIVFTLLEYNFLFFLNSNITGYFIFKQLFYRIVPLLIKNLLFTYISLEIDYVPSTLYELLYYMFLWIAPVLPKSPWILEAIINSIFPGILLLYIIYFTRKKSRFTLNRVNNITNPSAIIPFSIVLVMLIWFALGIFPIKPVGIATGSMYPEIKAGDAVIIKKCTPNDIVLGDVIEYKMNGYTVIHRVIEIYQKDGEFFFITKGDNNDSKDSIPVSEDQLIGKVIYKIPYIALPSIWIHNLASKTEVEVETGK